jgi:hypothetical protein
MNELHILWRLGFVGGGIIFVRRDTVRGLTASELTELEGVASVSAGDANEFAY